MSDTTHILIQGLQNLPSQIEKETSFNEIVKNVIAILTLLITAFLTYWFGIMAKHKDKDFARNSELNIVLSNLLIVWDYLIRLSKNFKLKYDDKIILPIPKDYISLILLKSGVLNDKIFEELDLSIVNLKKYDPLGYYDMEGIGRKLEFLKRSFVIPFLRSKSTAQFNKVVSDKYLKISIGEIEKHIKTTAKQVNRTTYKKTLLKIKANKQENSEEIKNDFLKDYYELSIATSPNFDMTFEDFVKKISTPEAQENMLNQWKTAENIDYEELMEIIAENPNMTFEELEQKLKKTEP